MKLLYLGALLDTIQEHELLDNNEFGFRVYVIYKSSSQLSLYNGEQYIAVYNNLDQIE